MDLRSLTPAPGSKKKRKRIGRGPGSGTGSQSGKGHKGQKARSGYKAKFWNEGGQMPLARRLPKRGFTNIFKQKFQVVNVGSLSKLSEEIIDRDIMLKNRLVRNRRIPCKVLGVGDITRSFTVKAHAFSRTAVDKIQQAGGKVEVIK